MSDLQRELRTYIDHLAGIAEQNPRARTAPIPRRHPRPRRPVLALVAPAVVVAVVVGWIALDGDEEASKISTPAATTPEPTLPEPLPLDEATPLPPADAVWDAIATCETGGNWDAAGQKYQGGLGIYSKNWEHYGGYEFAPTAGQATREQQIVVAERIRAEHGLGAWGCAKTLGYVRSGPEKYVNKRRGFSVMIPTGWEEQQLANSSELFRASSLELVSTCGGTAVTYAGWVAVREIPKHSPLDAEPRPGVIDPTSGTSGTTPSVCQGDIPVAPTQSIVFVERNRTIQVTLSFYPGASLANRAEAYEMLNSMRFKRTARASARGDE